MSIQDKNGFKKSSACGPQYCCVEVNIGLEVQVRDSKNLTQDALTFNRGEWKAFIAGVKAGEFDI